MNAVQKQVHEFHLAGGHVINSEPTLIEPETVLFRVRLMIEELSELIDAMAEENLEHVAKELADLLYVTYGTAISYGIDIEPVSAEVHRSNMTKFGNSGAYAETCDETGKSIRDASGKTLKPACYEPPKLAPLLEAQKNPVSGCCGAAVDKLASLPLCVRCNGLLEPETFAPFRGRHKPGHNDRCLLGTEKGTTS